MNPTAQDPTNTDLWHAHNNGLPIPEISQRTMIPPHTLVCIMGHETCNSCGGPDDELHAMSQLHDVLGRCRE